MSNNNPSPNNNPVPAVGTNPATINATPIVIPNGITVNPAATPFTISGNTTSGSYITYTSGWITTFPIIAQPPVETETKKAKSEEGLSCRKCDTYYPMAEPNQDDGSLICYACRHNL